MIRTLKIVVQERCKKELDLYSFLTPRLGRHSSWLIMRYRRRAVRGDCDGEDARAEGPSKMEARWQPVIRLGRSSLTNEHMVGAPDHKDHPEDDARLASQ